MGSLRITKLAQTNANLLINISYFYDVSYLIDLHTSYRDPYYDPFCSYLVDPCHRNFHFRPIPTFASLKFVARCIIILSSTFQNMLSDIVFNRVADIIVTIF